MLTKTTVQMLDLMLAQAVMYAYHNTPTQAQDQTGHIQQIKILAAAARIITQAVAGLLRAETLIVGVIADQRREMARGHDAPSDLGDWMENGGKNDDGLGVTPKGPDAFDDLPEVLERKQALLYREMAAILGGDGQTEGPGRSETHECPGVSLEPDGASASDRG